MLLLAMAGLPALPAAAQAPAGPTESSGALLYATHCNGCHTSQVHWRDRKLVTDRASLDAQVRRWQRAAGLAWSDDEVAAVVRYLDAVHYRLGNGVGAS
jgi:cytochrome c5